MRVNDTLLLRDSVFRDCGYGTHVVGGAVLHADGNLWAGNGTGLRVTAGNVDADGGECPNQFVGNQTGALLQGTSPLDRLRARLAWWHSASGPASPSQNPSGTGDPVFPSVEFQPFLAAPPDWSDARPVVRLTSRIHPVVESGEKVFLQWSARDDGVITSFDVQWFDPQAFEFVNLATGLPGWVRGFELVVPDIGIEPNFPRAPFRILAHDDAGQTGIEQFWLVIPADDSVAPVTFHTQLGPYVGGEVVTVCYDAPGIQSTAFTELFVETGADDRIGLPANGTIGLGQCTFSGVTIPHASTNRARFALRAEGTGSLDEWYFSDYFTIRPDPRIGDAPPTVSMTAPLDGQGFRGGRVVPIRWTASDDVGLYEFRIQASLNGGRTFHTIAESLAPTARGYSWRLPASSGVADVRVRVVAVDTLLQNTVDGDDVIIEVLPGRLLRDDPDRMPGPPLSGQ